MTGPGEHELRGRRILLVEGEILAAMFMEDMLLELGWEVVGPASNVADALDLAARERPDAAVLDVNLGDEPVYPVADALRQAGVPFVFVTGYSQAGLADAYRSHPFLMKPIDPDTFGADLAAGLREAAGRVDGAAAPPPGPG